MALGNNLWRPFPCDAWDWLQDCDPLAQRLLLWMWTGPESSACGLLRLREYSAAGALKSKPAAIRKALAELVQAGRVVVQSSDSGRHELWLDRYLTGQTGNNSDYRQKIKREIDAFADGVAKSQAIEDWRLWNSGYQQPVKSLIPARPQAEPTQHKTTEQYKTEASVPKGTDTSATAAEPLALTLELQADEVDPFANQPDPWADLKQKYDDPATVERYTPTGSRLLPEYQHKVAKVDAVAKGILLPEQEQAQLAMDLPAGKTRKPLSDTQLDAIFAKRKMLEICNHWNAVMAGKNAPCVPKSIMAKAGTLMANVARFEHREPLQDARWLFDWAMAIDPYHSGRQGKPWTLQAWLSADHLSAVFAAYRTHKGDSKQYTLDLDRTIRHWRLAVETAELNNKIAAQREAA